MNSDRPPPPAPAPAHRTTTSTGDLFICFTSRLHSSSSSMKSILSPGRTNPREPQISLSASLSRRLRTSRSIKGGASPAMFPTTGKKRGGAGGFENAEPSSPKVTCIGQVRVKSKKKQGKKMRSLSRRHSTGDVSFRKLELSGDGFSKSCSNSFGSNRESLPEQRNNQRWVHLPLAICEALRAFGSEFSCLFPCRSSCFSPAKEEKTAGECHRRDSGSCSAVLTRWLVALNDGDGAGGVAGDIELVVEDNDDEDEEDRSFRASRRHVFDDLEIINDRIEGCKDESRVSICIPPKNALLLMRCRSDPLKMEALANRLWDSTIGEDEDEDNEFEDQIEQKPVDLKESEAHNQEHETNMKQSIESEKENQEQIIETHEDDEDLMFLGLLFEETTDQNQEIPENEEMETQFTESNERGNEVLERESLPECLLLMMCEPKLSMEVSKETWVCSKDFIRRQSSKKKPPPAPAPVKSTGVQEESKVSAPAPAPESIQPRRSSCSLPAPPSMAEMLEQKLVNAVGYEPFVLTRCKSEPMRTAAAKLTPETCFWKNRKLEPLRRASFGVGAAGVGF